MADPTAVIAPPRRIQRQRTKGWRAPEGAIYVGRGGNWGNPFAVGIGVVEVNGMPRPTLFQQDAPRVRDAAHAVDLFRRWIEAEDNTERREAARRVLAGRDLTCWCPVSQPCHADVLMAVAAGKLAAS